MVLVMRLACLTLGILLLTTTLHTSSLESAGAKGTRPTKLAERQPQTNCKPQPRPFCSVLSHIWPNDNGQCNHLNNSRLGATNTGQIRLARARYQDDVWEPLQLGWRSTLLPTPRQVSTATVTRTVSLDEDHTLMFAFAGQLVAHDLVLSSTKAPKQLSSCCAKNKWPDPPLDPLCRPIHIPKDDYLYGDENISCVNQFRSEIAVFVDCDPHHIVPTNRVTHSLDASMIYGSGSEVVRELREKRGGKMKMDQNNILLIKNERLMTGESRGDVIPPLTYLHTLFAREHNRVVQLLAKNHPEADSLNLFMSARRIVVATYQRIIYHEYLPIVLGEEYMTKNGLSVDIEYNQTFSENIDPSISVEFSSAAFRFGHSQIPSKLNLQSADGHQHDVPLAAMFFGDEMLQKANMMSQMTNALLSQRPEKVDSSFSSLMHERLFANSSSNKGLDIVAINLNRGRDHGLPSFVEMLELCFGVSIADDWAAVEHYFQPDYLSRLKSVYNSPRDIELYIGGILEKQSPGALVGSVFQCIIGDQFYRLRYGDRFFYLNGNLTNSFTPEQMKEIQKASLARILCDNIEDLAWVQLEAFKQPSIKHNWLRSCASSAIPTLNMTTFTVFGF